jgi:hypothetical protein
MNMRVMEILDHTGHQTVTWDPNDEASVTDARRQFDRLRAQGYSMFRMAAIGQTAVVEEPDQSQELEEFNAADGRVAAVRIDEFDPQAERVTAIPQRVGG